MTNSENVDTADRLSFTLFIATALHAMFIFGLSFSHGSGTKIAPTLNVTLATHRSKEAPEKADFLAQYDQIGSGTETEVKEITTRNPAEFDDLNIRDITPITQQQARHTAENRTHLVTGTTNQRKVIQPTDSQQLDNQHEQQGDELEAILTNPEIASLKAKIDRQMQELANKPRIRRLTSLSTKASEDAAYLNSWAQKVERIGNENFPAEALRREIFGTLRLAVLINANGTLADVEILQSSGHDLLDEAALQIVRLAAPFDRFPSEIRKHSDQIEIIRTWQFEITGLITAL